MKKSKQTATTENREGIAAVELAVCLPLILVLLLGTLQACSMLYLRQNLSIAAYEGVRKCVKYQPTVTDAEDAAMAILTQRKVSGGTVSFSPADFVTQPKQTWVTITVTAPCNTNAPLRGWFYENRSLSASATMMKEF